MNRRWRVRFVPGPEARFTSDPVEIVAEGRYYPEAVAAAGRELCAGMKGEMANRMWWSVTLIELVQEPLSGSGAASPGRNDPETGKSPSGVLEFDGIGRFSRRHPDFG